MKVFRGYHIMKMLDDLDNAMANLISKVFGLKNESKKDIEEKNIVTPSIELEGKPITEPTPPYPYNITNSSTSTCQFFPIESYSTNPRQG